MRRLAARRAFPARSHDPLHGLQSLAAMVDDALVALGTQPAFAEATSSTRSSRLRTKSLGLRTGPPDDPPPGGATDNGRAPRNGSADRNDENGPGPAARREVGASDGIADDHVETWRLVERVQNGDGEAFGLLYERYVDMVYRFVYYRINDQHLAQDFTSETFLRALRRIGTISYQGRDIGAWFVTIARNIVLDHVKSARNRLESTTGETIEGREQAPSTENAVLTNLQNEQLMAAVAQLGDEQRECVTLRFVHGMSVNETASIMGKNDGAIKALQHRAVRKLADLVDHP